MENKSCVFEILSYMVKSGSDMKAQQAPSEATVRVKIGEIIEHKVAEGNGPVNALDNAMRKALAPHFPKLKDIKLKDFWVRINNGDDGTSASVEVLVISSDGANNWTTRAVSTDIIKASAEALIKSFEKAPFFSKKAPVLDES